MQTPHDEEQLYFPFAEPEKPAEVVKETSRLDKMPLVFESEDDALEAITAAGAQADEEWAPVQPTVDENDMIASQWLSRSEDTVPAETVAGISNAIPVSSQNEIASLPSVPDQMPEQGASFSPAEPTAEPDVEPAPSEIPVVEIPAKTHLPPALTPARLRRAAMGFLASQRPSALAARVQTLLPRYRADAAGCWLVPKQKNAELCRTMLVETSMNRAKCLPDPLEKARLQEELQAVQARKAALETEIRSDEPELKDDSLFEETQVWDYSASKNKAYHRCLRNLEKLEFALRHLTRYDLASHMELANEFYLAVPEGLIPAEEVAAGWGLLYVRNDLSVSVIKPAPIHNSSDENMTNLALRIAAASFDNTLFASGLSLDARNQEVRYRELPRRRSVIRYQNV